MTKKAMVRFDKSARDAVSLGLDETRAQHLSIMPSINLLVGLQLQMGEEEKFLREEGLTIELVRRRRDQMFPAYKPKKPEEVAFAPITLDVFDLARKLTAPRKKVTSRELLLAVFRKEGGVAAQIIIGLGKTPGSLYSKLLMQSTTS